jgi:hypothetical protein
LSRIFWALSGPRTVASARLHGYLIHEYLVNRGWASSLLYVPSERISDAPMDLIDLVNRAHIRDGDIVVFQKLHGHVTVASMESVRRRHGRVIFIDCDYPLKTLEAATSNLTLCSSDYLASQYSLKGIVNVRVISEAYESSHPVRVREDDPPLCVWFGHFEPVRMLELRWLNELLARSLPDYRLLTIWNGEPASKKWDLSTIWSDIGQCDIALITGNDSVATSCKSPNRLVQAMALGLPVVAYPIPSYRPIIHTGRNGFLCRTEPEWIAALRLLRSVAARRQVGELGYRFARRYFSPRRIGIAWEAMFAEALK